MFNNEELAEELQDGIYFNMHEDQYHAIDRLSATGIKKLMISPLQYFVENYDDNYRQKFSVFMTKGKAYHKRVLEGIKAFNAAYVSTLLRNDHPAALDSQNDLKEWCKSHDLPVSGTKPVLTQRILDADPEMAASIMSLIQLAFDEKHQNQEQIPREDFDEIERAATILEASDLGMLFSAGYPEVSILWTCPESGVKCKARIDYLRHDMISDLKTFSNSKRKSIEVCAIQAIAYEKYNVQAVHYMNGLNQIKKMIKSGNAYCDDAEIQNGGFFDMLTSNSQEFVFIFQEAGQVNNCIARKFTAKTHSVENMYWLSTQDTIYAMTAKYKSFMKTHGRDNAWYEHQKAEYLDDSDMPMWMSAQ